MLKMLFDWARSRWDHVAASLMGGGFVRQAGILTAGNVIAAALSLLQGVVVARWLGPELYGVTALILSYPDLIYTLLDARSVEASVKYVNQFHARQEHTRVLAVCKLGYLVDLIIAGAAVLAVAATANLASERLVHHSELTFLMVAYALGFLPRALVGTSQAVMWTLGQFPLIARLNAFTSLLRAAVVLTLVILGWSVTGVVLGSAVVMAFTGLAYFVAAHRLMRGNWGGSALNANLQLIRESRSEILRFLLYNDLHALLGVIPKQLDLVLLGYLRGPTEAGYYKMGKSMASSLGFLSSPLQSVAYPRLAWLHSMGKEIQLQMEVRKLAWRAGVPLAGLALLGMIALPWLLPMFVGSAYQPAVATAQLLLVAQIAWLAVFWLRPLYYVKGLIGQWTLGFAAYCVGFIALSVPLTILFANEGLALASTISALCFYIAMLRYVVRV